MKVIGAGVGRTGTYSLKLALNVLGLGPCHHMEEVLLNMPTQVPLWSAAADGNPDWAAIYDGYQSAVDWPTGAFFRELSAAYPEAKFVLSTRSPESWTESYSSTIHTLICSKDQAPEEMRDWLNMAERVIAKSGFAPEKSKQELHDAFIAHEQAVKAAIPADRLLVFQAKEGWAPLCAFLGQPVPDTPFPRTNDRAEFWDKVSGKG
ncbi:sulfotransferase family protein [Parvularcula marina]|uniref:Sulfotransferase family protein n=1 Tax=Parvularcula marina TaxID=2292771 RepID=A0A371RJ43_9PROT|nr:sulfotransferase family protein [Parvularcula marina]RFB05467.1 hypothetical protein DX908_09475 [Parvularcula marina]